MRDEYIIDFSLKYKSGVEKKQLSVLTWTASDEEDNLYGFNSKEEAKALIQPIVEELTEILKRIGETDE